MLALVLLLANFDWDATGRLAVLLAGQAGLRQILRLSHLEALAQRITIRFALRGFDRDTTRLYLDHRLQARFGLSRPLFTAPAHEALFDASQGVMRRIDALAHHALAAAGQLARQARRARRTSSRAAEELRA